MRFSFIILTVLIVLSAVACSSANDSVENIVPSSTNTLSESESDDQATRTETATPKPTPEPTVADTQKVTVEKQGFSNDPGGTTGPSYAVILKNQSARSSVESVNVQIAFYDASGVVLDTETQYVSFLQPGEVTAVGGDAYGVTGAASDMRVQVRATNWSKWDKAVTTLAVSNLAISYQQYLGPKVTGEISNPFTKDLEDIEAIAVYYDSAGNILAGDFTFIDFVPAGGTAAFDITHFDDLPTLDHAEVYAQLSSLTLVGLN
jgi:hypothetical protein